MRALLAALLVPLVLVACATDGEAGDGSYAAGAQQNYEAGLEALEDGNVLEAIRLFDHVRTKYPYSSYAPLAELRAADAEFRRDRYAEAIDAYQRFIKFHPAHPEVDWAAFRIGEAHFEAIPSDFFLLPPPSQKDQTEVRAARTSLEDFLARYPQSQYVPRARELLRETLGVLARHEVYVAEFYARRERWAAVATRYEYLLENYAGSGLDGRAAAGLLAAAEELGTVADAKAFLSKWLATHPDSPDAAEIRALVGKGG